MKRTPSFYSLFSVFGALFLFAGVLSARALEYGAVGGRPAYPDPAVENSGSWFIYHLAPGEKKDDGVIVMNLFEEEWNVLVYAADTTRSSGGGFALRQYTEPKEEVGAWVKFYPDPVPEVLVPAFSTAGERISVFCDFTRDELVAANGSPVADADYETWGRWCAGKSEVRRTMAPQEKTLVPFVFSVPPTADVGEHAGGILIEKLEPDTLAAEGSSMQLVTRVGVRIYETVPGAIVKKLSFEDFRVTKNFNEFNYTGWFDSAARPDEYVISSRVKNEGNVSLEHEDIIRIRPLFGGEEEEVRRSFQALKQDSFVSNYAWHNPRFGRFLIEKEFRYTDEQGKERVLTTAPITVWIFPVREMAAALLLLLLFALAFWAWRARWRRRYGGRGWVPYQVQPGDTVQSLATACRIDWLVLARTNRLKPPYALNPGRRILLPRLRQAPPVSPVAYAPVFVPQPQVQPARTAPPVRRRRV